MKIVSKSAFYTCTYPLLLISLLPLSTFLETFGRHRSASAQLIVQRESRTDAGEARLCSQSSEAQLDRGDNPDLQVPNYIEMWYCVKLFTSTFLSAHIHAMYNLSYSCFFSILPLYTIQVERFFLLHVLI